MRTMLILVVVLCTSACASTGMSRGADPIDVSMNLPREMLRQDEQRGTVTALYFSREEFLVPNFSREPRGPFVESVVLSGEPIAHQVFRHLPFAEPRVIVEVLRIRDPDDEFLSLGAEERLLAIEMRQFDFSRIGHVIIERCRRRCQMTLEGVYISIQPRGSWVECEVLRPRYGVRCYLDLFYE